MTGGGRQRIMREKCFWVMSRFASPRYEGDDWPFRPLPSHAGRKLEMTCETRPFRSTSCDWPLVCVTSVSVSLVHDRYCSDFLYTMLDEKTRLTCETRPYRSTSCDWPLVCVTSVSVFLGAWPMLFGLLCLTCETRPSRSASYDWPLVYFTSMCMPDLFGLALFCFTSSSKYVSGSLPMHTKCYLRLSRPLRQYFFVLFGGLEIFSQSRSCLTSHFFRSCVFIARCVMA